MWGGRFCGSLGLAAVAIGGLAGIQVLTEVLSPGAYGELPLAMTVVAIAQLAFQQPLFEGSRRFYIPASETEESCAFLQALWRSASACS